MSFPVSLIGDVHQGEAKWAGGALASDGCIYAAPMFALQILKIDPKNLTTTLVGPPIPGFGKSKYMGAVATNDGFVYFVPYQAAQVLKFNIETQEIELIGDKFPSGTAASKAYKWIYGVMGKDGCIYCSPSNANQILKVDPSDDSTSLVGDKLGGKFLFQNYHGAVASKDKATIYFIPGGSKTILSYDVDTERCTHISIGHLNYGNSETLNWAGAALGPDGCIYAVPYDATKVLKYDPSRKVNDPTLDDYDETMPENPTLVGKDFGSENGKWGSFVFGRDGYLYGTPGAATKVLRFNPLNETTALVGNDFPGNFKWAGSVLDKNGNIVGIPLLHPRVLRIIPSLFNYNPRSKTSYQPCGMDDSPNDRADRLGYELYAEALVDHILSIERTGESISVGLFAPWGSGKSFFWNLCRKEFARRNKQDQEEYQGSTTEQEVEIDEEKSLFSILFDMLRQLDHYHGKFLYWPLAILFLVIVLPPLLIIFFFLYLQAVFTKLDYKLTNSSWGNKYESLKGMILPLKGMILLWQNNIVSFCSLAFLGIPLLWNWVWKGICFVFRSLFCCYKRGMWKIKRHKDTIYIYVEFDAWTYRGTENIWASMLEMLWRAVEEELGSEKVKWHRAGIALASSKLSDHLDIRLRKEEMARKKLQIKLNLSIAFLAWSLVGVIATVAVFLINYFQTDGNGENCGHKGKNTFGCMISGVVVTTVTVSTIASVVNLTFRLQNNRAILQPGSKKITDKVNYYNRKDFKTDIGFMGMVQDEVFFLFEFLKAQNAQIRLFVDDLDRCNQDVAMDVLWAISLLFGPGDGPCPITSFLAIDTKVLVDYIEDEFDGKVNGFGYLEKIINLPFSIPPIGNEKKIDFCNHIVDTHELTVSQVYRKALNFKYKYLGETQDIVNHLNEGALKIGDAKSLLGDLISMGEKMNLSGEEKLDYIGTDLLNLSNVTKSPSRQEDMLVILRGNIDILENDVLPFQRPSDVYKNLHDLLSQNVWIGEVLGVTLTAPREGALVLSIRKEDDLVQELYEACCVSGKSEKMREAFPMPRNLGIGSSRSITEYVKNLTDDLDTMLKNLNVSFVLALCKKQTNIPFTPTVNMDKEHELCMLALSLGLKSPDNEYSDNSEEWKQFLFKVQIVLKTQLVSQTCLKDPGNNGDSGGSDGDFDDSNHDGSMASDNISGSSDDTGKSTLDPNINYVPAANITKPETDSKERPFYEYKSMVTDDEREFLRVYSCLLDGVPRKIKRILNVYNVTRYIAYEANGESVESIFLEKLFIFTVLQELCPYRSSWLIFISACAQEEESNAISYAEDDESMSFYSLLNDLKMEKQCNSVKDLSLATVYFRIVCGVLNCIPSAERNLHADSGIISYKKLLKNLVLGDLYPDCLQNYVFNLPRSMMNEIKMHENHSVIGKRVRPQEEKDKGYWVASFESKATLESAKIFERKGTNKTSRFLGFDGVVKTRSNSLDSTSQVLGEK